MKTLPRSLSLSLVMLAALVASVALICNSVRYKPYGVPDLLLPKWEALQVQVAVMESARKQSHRLASGSLQAVPSPAIRGPVAVVDEVEFDFGMLAPGTSSSHVFTIRNEGQLPLVITPSDTSCKCTVSKTSREVLEPGGDAQVTLTWNTGTSREFYRQYAVIKTNDPQRREIEFGVTGRIKSYLAFDVDQLSANVDPGESVKASVVLFSQTLPGFEISSIDCALPGFAYVERTVAASDLASLGATCARRIDIVTDAPANSGEIQERMRVHIRPLAGGGEPVAQLAAGGNVASGAGDVVAGDVVAGDVVEMPHGEDRGGGMHCEIPVVIRVAAAISCYGADLHAEEGLNLGVIKRGVERVARVIVRIRGDRPPEELRVTRLEPAFLQAAIESHASKPGTYTLTIRVPADAPEVVFNLQQRHGVIEFGDPQNPAQSSGFPILGAVLSR